MAEIVAEAPHDAPLIVRPDPGWHRNRNLPVIIASVIVGIAAIVIAIVVAGRDARAVVVGVTVLIAALCLVLAGFGAFAWRSAAGLGPNLVANDDGLWIRLGGAARPKLVRLQWSEVSRIELTEWKAPNGKAVEYLTIDAPQVAKMVRAQPDLARATQPAKVAFGTPFALTGKGKDTDVADMLAGLREIAPPEKFAE